MLTPAAVRLRIRAAPLAVRLTTAALAPLAVRLRIRAGSLAVRLTTASLAPSAVRLQIRAGSLAVRLTTAAPLNLIPFSVEYSETCASATVTFSVPVAGQPDPYVAVVSTYTDRKPLPAIVTVLPGIVRVVFNTTADALFRVQLSQLAPVGDVRFAGLCRAGKCWRAENARMAASAPLRGDGPSDRWKQLVVKMAVAEAAAALGDYDCAQQAIDSLTRLCSDDECGCCPAH